MTETQQLENLLATAQYHFLRMLHNGRSKKALRQQADRAYYIHQQLQLAKETTHD